MSGRAREITGLLLGAAGLVTLIGASVVLVRADSWAAALAAWSVLAIVVAVQLTVYEPSEPAEQAPDAADASARRSDRGR